MGIIDDLAAKYGGGEENKSSSKSSSIDDLAAKYGGDIQIGQPKDLATTGGPDYRSVGLNRTEEENQKAIKQGQESKKGALEKAADYVTDFGPKYKHALSENFVGSRDMASSGIENIKQGNVAQGAGKTLMGGLGMVTAPVIGAPLDVIGNEATNVTGDPKFGEKVKLLPTTGLPVGIVAKTASVLRPTNQAIKGLIETIRPENIPEVIARMKENPRLSVMDIVDPVRQMGQKLVVTEGPHQNVLEKATKSRIAEARGVAEGAINDAMGAPVNVYNKLEEMKSAAREVGKKVINPALEGAKSVDVSGVISHIDKLDKPGVMSAISEGEQLPSADIVNRLKEIRKYLTDDKSVMTDPKRLHTIQSSLRSEAEDLLHSSTGSDRLKGRAIMNVRQQIVDAIDEASGPKNPDSGLGPYKTGLSGYRDEKQIHEAFDKGTEILRNRSTKYDDLPEFWQNWIKNAKPEELAAAREGARTAYRQQVSSLKNAATKAEQVPEIEFNKEKLKMLFNEKSIDKMARQLKDEREIAVTNHKLYHDSQTAMRLKANSQVDLPKPNKSGSGLGAALPVAAEMANQYMGGYLGAGAIGYGASAGLKTALKYGFDKAQLKLAMSKNEELTKLLTAKGADRDELIKALSAAIPGPKQNLLTRGTSALQNVVGP